MELNVVNSSSMGKHIILLIAFILGIKLVYLLIPMISNPDFADKTPYRSYITIVKKNDAYWYKSIAEKGYPKVYTKRDLGYSEGPDFKQSEWAFFPFYPALNAFTMDSLKLNYNHSALLWSLVFSILAILGMYWFSLAYFENSAKAFTSTLLLFCFPFSFYFSMYYTEALFFTFTILSFLSIHHRKYFLLALCLIPLTLLRPNGIVLLLPLYLYHLERQGIIANIKIQWQELLTFKNIGKSVAFVSAPVAFVIYGFYQLHMTGYFFAFSIAQDGWYRELSFPLVSFFNRGDLATQFNSIFTIGVIVYAFWNRKKLPLSLNVLIVVSLLLPLCSGSVLSMTRFVSILFPLFFVLGNSIHTMKRPYLAFILVFILHLVSFYPWTIHHPISF
jgi:hypothetical protein